MESPEPLPVALEAILEELLEVVDETHREQLTKGLRIAYALGYIVGLRPKTHALIPRSELKLHSDDVVTTA